MRASVVLMIALVMVADASADEPSPCDTPRAASQPFTSTSERPGYIRLHLFLAQGAPVTFYECLPGKARVLGTAAEADDITTLAPAARWRCDVLERAFAATATLPDGRQVRGSTDVRTRSCQHRYELTVPPRVEPGALVRVRVTDRWGMNRANGRLCVSARCQKLSVGPRDKRATRAFRVPQRGVHRIVLRMPHARVTTRLSVGVPAVRRRALPTVLATGDSTMIGVESFLADRLAGRAEVVADVRPGESQSKHYAWPGYARRQVAEHQQAFTVYSLGANEGYPMGGRKCCGRAWIRAYARRVRATVRVYLRTGPVLLLTVPAPRDRRRLPAAMATNAAIASLDSMPRVGVLRMDRVFASGNHREPDGIHLNVTGTAIAARRVARTLSPLLP